MKEVLLKLTKNTEKLVVRNGLGMGLPSDIKQKEIKSLMKEGEEQIKAPLDNYI